MKYLLIITIGIIAFIGSLFMTKNIQASSPTIVATTTYFETTEAITSKTISFTVSAGGENKMLVVGVMSPCFFVTTGTWNGTSMDGTIEDDGAINLAGKWFYLANPETGTHNIVVNFASCGYVKIFALDLSNANVASDISTSASKTHYLQIVGNDSTNTKTIAIIPFNEDGFPCFP
jgi:hypothetical protein